MHNPRVLRAWAVRWFPGILPEQNKAHWNGMNLRLLLSLCACSWSVKWLPRDLEGVITCLGMWRMLLLPFSVLRLRPSFTMTDTWCFLQLAWEIDYQTSLWILYAINIQDLPDEFAFEGTWKISVDFVVFVTICIRTEMAFQTRTYTQHSKLGSLIPWAC